MTQQEFETLTGLHVEAEEYERIEEVYMATETDKQLFCKMWKEATEASRYHMLKMAEQHDREKKSCKRYVEEVRDAHKTVIAAKNAEIKALLDAMFESVHEESDTELRKACIEHMGKTEYLRKMLDKGYEFWDEDKELLKEILAKAE